MKYPIILLSIFLISPVLVFAQADRNWELQNYTSADKLEIVDDFSQVSGMVKIGEIFSKARGVTWISAMNRVNNRAIRKLKAEATMRGASHILITKNSPEGSIVRFVSYTASLYKKETVKDLQSLNSLLNNNTLYFSYERTLNRNSFGEREKYLSPPFQLRQVRESYISNNKMIIEVEKGVDNQKSIPYDKYEVIAFDEKSLVLFKESSPDKTMKLYYLNTAQ